MPERRPFLQWIIAASIPMIAAGGVAAAAQEDHSDAGDGSADRSRFDAYICALACHTAYLPRETEDADKEDDYIKERKKSREELNEFGFEHRIPQLGGLPSDPPYFDLYVRNSGPIPIYLLAFRGTSRFGDMTQNILAGAGSPPSYYRTASEISRIVLANAIDDGACLILTGHSLGGGMAEFVAAQLGLNAVTFNSSHLSGSFPHSEGFRVETFNTVGSRPGDRLFSDQIHWYRLGGKFDQTVSHAVEIDFDESDALKNFEKGHAIDTFIEHWREPQSTPWNLGYLVTERSSRTSGVAEVPARIRLLEGSPNLVGEVPAPVRATLSRAQTNHAHLIELKSESLPAIWDGRIRVGALYDSRPSAGVEEETLRIFEAPAIITGPRRNDGDFARLISLQVAWSKPLGDSILWSWAGTFYFSNLDYVRSNPYDTSEGALTFGIQKTTDPRRSPDNQPIAGEAVASHQFSLAGEIRAVEIGVADTANLIGGITSASQTWTTIPVLNVPAMTWQALEGGIVNEFDRNEARGWAYNGSAGIRIEFADEKTFAQLRAFAGRRDADNDLLSVTQWGVGAGMFFNLSQRCRFFVEPSVRWTNHHANPAPGSRLSDQTYLLRIQMAVDLGAPDLTGPRHLLHGWELAAGYTLSINRSASATEDYDRHRFSLQASRRF